jgi:hypothetical protein
MISSIPFSLLEHKLVRHINQIERFGDIATRVVDLKWVSIISLGIEKKLLNCYVEFIFLPINFWNSNNEINYCGISADLLHSIHQTCTNHTTYDK